MTTPDDPMERLQARYAESIGVLPDVPKRLATEPGPGESLHVEIIDGNYVLVACHEGRERQRRSTDDMEQAMHWVLSYMGFQRYVGTLTMDR